MRKIYLFGGTSEIGGAIVKQIADKFFDVEKEVVRITTSEVVGSGIRWNPTSIAEVRRTLEKLDLKGDDIVVIALGTLRDIQDEEFIDPNGLDDMYRVNQIIPTIVLADTFNKLSSLGGGNILVLTSTAAFPVLDENFIYGSAKSNLDAFAKYLQRISKSNNVKISIVRSSFVATKLNLNRKPTPFSLTTDQVAKIVVRNFGRKVIWTPRIFQSISFILTHFPLLKFVANHFIRKSRN
jgi:short-subunit dehydrogenase